MKIVYIAGPFRGSTGWEIEENVRRAERLALEVWKLGAVALCPHLNTRFFQGVLPDEIWLEGTLALLARCDVLMLTDNWQQSSGAREEVRIMRTQYHKPVFDLLGQLAQWLQEN